MTMRVGSLVFSTEQGLGILAKSFYDHGVLTDVAVIRHGKRQEHDEWYPGAMHVGNLRDPYQVDKLKAFCASMDVMVFFETPFVWELLPFCRSIGVPTVLCPMYECTPDQIPALPDLFACPSLLDVREMATACGNSRPLPSTIRFVPIPVDTERVKWRLRERAEVFVHNAGHGGLRGRNGTAELLEAIRLVKSPAKFIIRAQEVVPTLRENLTWNKSPAVTGVFGGVPYSDLFTEGDVFVFPEKHNGLSLPLQEAHAAGMVVMATDRFPNNTWLPTEPLILPDDFKRARVAAYCREYDEAVVSPLEIASRIDEYYGCPITDLSERGREWASRNSWDALKPVWVSLLHELIDTRGK